MTNFTIEQLDCVTFDWTFKRDTGEQAKDKLASFWQSSPQAKEAARSALRAVSKQYPDIAVFWLELSIDPDANDTELRCVLRFKIPGAGEMTCQQRVDWNWQFAEWWVRQDAFEDYLSVPYWQGVIADLS